MKVVTKEEEAEHYNAVVKGGLVGGTIGLAIGVTGVIYASRRYPSFRGLTLPFRTFLVTSTGTFGAIVQADRAGIAYQQGKDPMAKYRDNSQRAQEIIRENETAYERFMNYGREHRYSIVGASWLASLAIALALGLTLAVLIVSAAFEMNDAKNAKGRWETVMVLDPNDPEHKHLIEKRIHKEEYEGQDLWMDMVEAEEKRLAARKAEQEREQQHAQ
ncbi:hypothetical protein TrVFT333_003062 [Trichoderma virens FT-333]|nr:hypothetical protein TrVFT333_003062 [Trichoderma virens FT-333]